MPARRFLPLLLAPLLGGCGAVAGVRAAFEMPTAPPPTPSQQKRAKDGKAFTSLAKSLQGFDRKTLDAFVGRWNAKAGTPRPFVAPPFFPRNAVNPARALQSDLARANILPAFPLARAGSSARESSLFFAPPAPAFSAGSVALPPRTLHSENVPASSFLPGDVNAFLRAWAARQSLSRADELLLGRRALNERLVLESRAPREGIDLSLVPPEVQLELTNLRLQLLPLLSVSPAQRRRADARIDEIERRLAQIWARETARQNELLRQSLEEAPARLQREGLAALALQTRQNAQNDAARRAQVGRDLAARTNSPSPSQRGLQLRQNAATAPDEVRVSQTLRAPFAALPSSRFAIAPMSQSSETIAARGNGLAAPRLSAAAQKQARLWRDATR